MVFILLILVRLIYLLIVGTNNQGEFEPVRAYLSDFIFLSLCSVAFAFYLRYVGSVSLSFYNIFKVVLISLAPVIVLRIFERIQDLIDQNKSLIAEKKAMQKQVEKYEEDNLNKSLEFVSENSSENLTFLVAEVAFVKSADNYVEIVYKEEDTFKKKLIRNTLKNVEVQLKQYSNFIRCHRTCIVNIHYIEKLNSNYGSHWITIKDYNYKIPVSRQYLLKLKEAF